jgi:ketosteroid isomerase-like protein
VAPVQTAPVAPKAPAVTASVPVAPAVALSAPAAASSDKEVAALVRAWATAWAAKDVKGYLGFYSKNFDPAGAMSRSAWEDERRQRISGKATISVKLSNLVVSSSGSKATAKFRQDYKSGGLDVTSRKTLELQKTGDRWHIVKESVGN